MVLLVPDGKAIKRAGHEEAGMEAKADAWSDVVAGIFQGSSL